MGKSTLHSKNNTYFHGADKKWMWEVLWITPPTGDDQETRPMYLQATGIANNPLSALGQALEAMTGRPYADMPGGNPYMGIPDGNQYIRLIPPGKSRLPDPPKNIGIKVKSPYEQEDTNIDPDAPDSGRIEGEIYVGDDIGIDDADIPVEEREQP